MERQLDPDHFYRANRPYIITRKAVKSWRKQADRKISLNIQPEPDELVIVSREKAADFIAWVKKEVPATSDRFMN